jgi:Mrp family chromosome partitioning ATPase
MLPCGSVPPDPTRILSSQSMQRFREAAQNTFDLVIYDAPPLLGFADVSLLSAHTDALLLVVRLHQLKRVLLEQAVDALRFSGAPLMATVANGSEDASAFHAYHYQQDYLPADTALVPSASRLLRSANPLKLWKKLFPPQ